MVPLAFLPKILTLHFGDKMWKDHGFGILTYLESSSSTTYCLTLGNKFFSLPETWFSFIYKTEMYPVFSVWHIEGAEYILFTSSFSLSPSANTMLCDISPCFHSFPSLISEATGKVTSKGE